MVKLNPRGSRCVAGRRRGRRNARRIVVSNMMAPSTCKEGLIGHPVRDVDLVGRREAWKGEGKQRVRDETEDAADGGFLRLLAEPLARQRRHTAVLCGRMRPRDGGWG